MTETVVVRAWFAEHGWTLEPADLRAALEERGADTDLIVELIDEGADRRRAAVRESGPGSRNGHVQRSGTADAGLVPPQNLEAEEAVLGAALLSPAAIARCREILSEDGREFYRDSHARIWRAALELADRGEPVDAITLTAELERRGDLEDVGGRVRLHELAALVPASANAHHYAKIVAETSILRDLIRAGGELSRAGFEGGDAYHVVERTLSQLRALELPGDIGTPPEAITAGAFILDEPTDPAAIRVWGADTAIGWASGEALMLVGPDGVGKTTLGQQIALARAGLRTDVLGMHVNPDGRRVLYVAADRPRQAARSLRRMVTDSERDQLDEAITIWRGPLPKMLNEDRTLLTRLAKQFDAGTVVVDSLKDVAVDLATDETGGRVASAFQHLIASGVELLVMHHPRKPGVSDHRKPRDLADVYGSRLIFGVFGSVIMLWGDPGDVLIELRHLKQPIDEIGPWNLVHDHKHGKTQIEHGTDLLDVVLRAGTHGVTAAIAAGIVYLKETPSRQEIHRIRARLDRLADADKLVKLPNLDSSDTEAKHRYVYNGPAGVFE